MKIDTHYYKKGFESGKHWPKEWDYVPGGPFVYKGHNLALRHQSEKENRSWLMGWHDARKLFS